MRDCSVCKQQPDSDPEMFEKDHHPLIIYVCENCIQEIWEENEKYEKKWNAERGETIQ